MRCYCSEWEVRIRIKGVNNFFKKFSLKKKEER